MHTTPTLTAPMQGLGKCCHHCQYTGVEAWVMHQSMWTLPPVQAIDMYSILWLTNNDHPGFDSFSPRVHKRSQDLQRGGRFAEGGRFVKNSRFSRSIFKKILVSGISWSISKIFFQRGVVRTPPTPLPTPMGLLNNSTEIQSFRIPMGQTSTTAH
jgi:hypothetical protein